MRIATVGLGVVTDRQTNRQKDRHTDTGDFIICPMLCYSNLTDKNSFSISLTLATVAARGYLPPGANVCVAAPPHPVAYLEI